MDDLTKAKARAYDLIRTYERVMAELKSVNQAIVAMEQKAKQESDNAAAL